MQSILDRLNPATANLLNSMVPEEFRPHELLFQKSARPSLVVYLASMFDDPACLTPHAQQAVAIVEWVDSRTPNWTYTWFLQHRTAIIVGEAVVVDIMIAMGLGISDPDVAVLARLTWPQLETQ